MKPLALSGAPLTYTAIGTAASAALPNTGAELLIMTNLGGATIHVATDGTATATGLNRSYALLPGTSQTITYQQAGPFSIISAGANSDVQFQRASGGI